MEGQGVGEKGAIVGEGVGMGELTPIGRRRGGGGGFSNGRRLS